VGERYRALVADDPAPSPTLADVGEDGLLTALFPLLPSGPATLLGPGDDAAVLAAPDGRVVVTTDLVVEWQDFRRDWSSASDVGWKVAAQNLADVAAMGARPTGLVVGLVAPPHTEVAWVLDLGRGLAAACAGTGASVVGGDLSAGPVIMVSVTAFGDLGGRDPVLRSGARPGDVVAVAGRLGRSAAGLDLLLAGRPDLSPDLVAAHRRPTPPYAAGVAAALAGGTAMLDVSDGLLRDLSRVARASGVSIDLDWAALGPWDDDPDLAVALALEHALAPAGDSRSAWDLDLAARAAVARWRFTGGEDHVLAATFPSGALLPDAFVVVGAVHPALVGRPGVLLDGEDPASSGLDHPGWDHFAPRS
jgi:thiamine-monophosphate kinase